MEGPQSQNKIRSQKREYSQEFKEEAVQMMVDGHSAQSIVSNLGITSTSLLYKWKKDILGQNGETSLEWEQRVCELEKKCKRLETEREVLKKLYPFSARKCKGNSSYDRATKEGRFFCKYDLRHVRNQPIRLLRL